MSNCGTGEEDCYMRHGLALIGIKPDTILERDDLKDGSCLHALIEGRVECFGNNTFEFTNLDGFIQKLYRGS